MYFYLPLGAGARSTGPCPATWRVAVVVVVGVAMAKEQCVEWVGEARIVEEWKRKYRGGVDSGFGCKK